MKSTENVMPLQSYFSIKDTETIIECLTQLDSKDLILDYEQIINPGKILQCTVAADMSTLQQTVTNKTTAL